MHIVLIEPEIPANTGNIARTCACIGASLHLVEPLGFRLSEKHLKRAGLDYWDEVEIKRYPSTMNFFEQHEKSEFYLLSDKSNISLYETNFPKKEIFLLFGKESAGLDPSLLQSYPENTIRIPMRQGLRSLNLSNAVAIASYEVLRSWGFTDTLIG